jgi:hypothetical protein
MVTVAVMLWPAGMVADDGDIVIQVVSSLVAFPAPARKEPFWIEAASG